MSDTAANPAPDERDDLKSALNAAFEQQHAVAEVPEPAAEPADTPDEPQEPTGRARDASGRFAKAEAQEAAEPAAKAPEGTDKPTEPQAKPAEAEELTKATARWSPADREMVAKLPAEAREFLIRRHRDMEADHTRKTTEIAAFRRDWEPIDQLLAPHADLMRQKGFTKSSLVEGWYQVERSLMGGGDSAAQLVAGIVKNYGLDPSAVVRHLGIQPQAASGELPPPEGQQVAIPPEIAQRLEAHERYIREQQIVSQRREQMAFQDAATRVTSEIEQFASATDSAGALLHPHFHDVENDMAVLAQLARASGKQVPQLSDLYDQAVWANPSTRQRLQEAAATAHEAQRAAAEAERQKEVRAKAEQARRAAKPITGAPSANQVRQRGNGSLRDELNEAWEQTSAAA